MKYIWSRYQIHCFLILALLFAFPLLGSFQRTMFWDITLYNLPWRYHLSECIANGELPLWNPWMNYGFPQGAHYETWYPVSWIFAALFGYNIGTLQYEYLFDLLMAGIGFYKLSGLFKDLPISVRLSGAIAFMLCGVFISQATQLGYIASGAWMTFVFYYLILFLRNPTFYGGALLVFFYFLLITGGYPGNYIAVTYMCMLMAAFQLYKKWKTGKKDDLRKLSWLIPILTLVLFCLYAVAFLPALELQQYMTRQHLDYTNTGFGAMTGSTSLTGYLTLLSPSAAMAKNDFWGDYPMLNDVYFSFPIFLLAIFFLIRGKANPHFKKAWFLFAAALFFLMVSCATVFPVHHWLYQIIPLFDRFRFPSLFRIFFVLPLIFIGMFGLQMILQNARRRLEFFYTLIGIIALTSVALFFVSSNIPAGIEKSQDELILLLDQPTLVKLDLLILLVIALVLMLSLKWSGTKYLTLIFVLAISFDLGVHTWIRSPRFVSRDKDPHEISNSLDQITAGFPKIDQSISMKDAHKAYPPIDGLWLNTYAYYKYPQNEGSSPYATTMYQTVIRNHQLDTMLQLPFLDLFSKVADDHLQTNYYLAEESSAIECISAGPNGFVFHILNNRGNYAVFNHNTYPGWNFYENDRLLPSRIADTNFSYVQLTSDEAILKIRFEPKGVRAAFYLSASIFIILVLYLVFGHVGRFLRGKKLSRATP